MPSTDDNTAELLLENLKAVRHEVEGFRDWRGQTDKRLSQIERQLASVRGDLAVLSEMHVDQRDDMAALRNRLERHVGLTDLLSHQ